MFSQKSLQIIFALTLVLIFSAFFLQNLSGDLPLIFKKDLYAHDESSNSVVAANVTRKFFPPMVRINPQVFEPGNWMEGPFWQHIPPLFAYVPYLGFILDGKISIEVKRLSFAMIEWLTGVIFILVVLMYSKSLFAGLAALFSSYLWIKTPFTRELVTGLAFGVSDILLAFTVICSFAGILWYLSREKEERIQYSAKQLFVLVFIFSLPIITKNLLGLIPIMTFLIILFYDQKGFNKKVLFSLFSFLFYLILYFLILFLSSPATFINEFLVSIRHLNNYEGWGRPFAFYITDYLPHRYLGKYSTFFYFVFIFALALLPLRKKSRIIHNLLGLSSLWFLWNLIAVSFIISKVPNFIFQSYLLGLFFVVYSLFLILQFYGKPFWDKIILNSKIQIWSQKFAVLLLICSLLFAALSLTSFVKNLKAQKASAYSYQSEHEKFYQLAEFLQSKNVNYRDITVINYPPDDCWLRYYILFLTGAESKILLEIYFNPQTSRLKSNYENIYYITSVDQKLSDSIQPEIVEIFEKFKILTYRVNKLSEKDVESLFKTIFDQNFTVIKSEIERIKKDKTSCQWLVPDPILNAP